MKIEDLSWMNDYDNETTLRLKEDGVLQLWAHDDMDGTLRFKPSRLDLRNLIYWAQQLLEDDDE